ncbi:hypothetical protein LFL97_34145 [Burkholderia sp. JSH-S8]|nr:hypothetical protein LFL97_34145 [Burkholderia sp. JSH-S8]
MEDIAMFGIFNKLGKIISSIGAERFAADMHSLFIASMNVESIKIAMWFVNEREKEIVCVHSLGKFATDGRGDINTALQEDSIFEAVDNRLTKRVLIAREIHLIHFGASQARHRECKGGVPTALTGISKCIWCRVK